MNGLTQDQAKALPKYTTVRVRRNGRKAQLAVTTGEAHDVQGWTLLPFAYAFRDRGEVVLKSGSHVAVLGGAYPDEVEVVGGPIRES
jgi:hypothetical protein